jgi:hypothetical protein
VIFGCAALYPYPEAKTAEMAALTVSPQSQAQGDGERILKHIEHRAKAMGIEVGDLLVGVNDTLIGSRPDLSPVPRGRREPGHSNWPFNKLLCLLCVFFFFCCAVVPGLLYFAAFANARSPRFELSVCCQIQPPAPPDRIFNVPSPFPPSRLQRHGCVL